MNPSPTGIVKVKTIGYNQNNMPVIELKRNIMVWKRQYAPRLKTRDKRMRFLAK